MSWFSHKTLLVYGKHNHVYVLNYDLKSLEHKHKDEGGRQRAYASEEFY